MAIPKPAIIDFETKKILRRPLYPPKPVGVSIQAPGETRPTYFAWGHPLNNNCDIASAKRRLRDVYRSGVPLLFHNGEFDVDVAETWMECSIPSWDRIHDTMFLLFLDEPQAPTLALKPSAHRLLGMKPEEKNAVVEWLKEHKPDIREHDEVGDLLPWEAYISEAPGDLVGKYANGDVLRTGRIFQKLYKSVLDRDMGEAYDRERRLMPILLRNSREGIRTNFPLLESDREMFYKALDRVDNWLRKRLGDPNLTITSPEEMADAFERNKLVREEDWVITKTGKRSVSKKNLTPMMIQDKQVARSWMYRNKLKTCLDFMDTWYGMASKNKEHHIFTQWNQVRSSERGSVGAATGRQSSSPNFQNIPKMFEDRGDGYEHPAFMKGLPHLPKMRQYLVPDKGHTWIHRDYSQQELRILAHFEDGELLKAYRENPNLDVHEIVHEGFRRAGYTYVRTYIKNFDFQVVYGGGIPAICAVFNCTPEQAKEFVGILKQQLPGYDALNTAVKALGKARKPVITWGGRQYYAQEPGFSKKHNRMMTFEYKLLNYLIQGSAGDCTKEAIIRWDAHRERQARFLLSVHDEINGSAPTKRTLKELEILRLVMESIEFDLPMLSGGKFGPSWAELKKVA